VTTLPAIAEHVSGIFALQRTGHDFIAIGLVTSTNDQRNVWTSFGGNFSVLAGIIHWLFSIEPSLSKNPSLLAYPGPYESY
jgi:hypothetical protein